MKKSLVYQTTEDVAYMTPDGLMEYRVKVSGGDDIVHNARIVAIYRKRWEIELLFKQIKQNFPLRYFYGESANAIKIQVWVTLIANLLLEAESDPNPPPRASVRPAPDTLDETLPAQI